MSRVAIVEWSQLADRTPAYALVDNVDSLVLALRDGGHLLPISVSDVPGESYVCTPTAAYVDYARREIDLVAAPGAPVLRGLVGAAGALLRAARIDRIVNVRTSHGQYV